MSSRAFITGVSGLELSATEREFIRAERPWGFILFKRNVETPSQVSDLVGELRDCVGEADAPVLIDQEGGRVARLGPPHWPVYPPGATFGALYDLDRALGLKAARLSSRLIAADLIDLGISVDCLPLADVPVAGADAVIGNRAYGTEPGKVAAIARAVIEGLEQGGVLQRLEETEGIAPADEHRFRGLDGATAALVRGEGLHLDPLGHEAGACLGRVGRAVVQREGHEEQPLHPAEEGADLGHGVVEIPLSVVRRVAQ